MEIEDEADEKVEVSAKAVPVAELLPIQEDPVAHILLKKILLFEVKQLSIFFFFHILIPLSASQLNFLRPFACLPCLCAYYFTFSIFSIIYKLLVCIIRSN